MPKRIVTVLAIVSCLLSYPSFGQVEGASKKIQNRTDSALSPAHRQVRQRKHSADERFRNTDLHQFQDKNGAVTFTNVPEKYSGKKNLKRMATGEARTTKQASLNIQNQRVPKPWKPATRHTPREVVTPAELREIISANAKRYQLAEEVIASVIKAESNFNANAISSAGARGLMQLMPGTAADMGVLDIFDPSDNIMGGSQYLAKMMGMFGDLRLALAAYNSGPERVKNAGNQIPNISETRHYVAKVMSFVEGTMKDKSKLDQMLTAAGQIRLAASRPELPATAKGKFIVHFKSGLTQPADKIVDKEPYYYIEFMKRSYPIRKDLIEKIAEAA